MNMPLVSILIPVYKVEKYIERCARSVFGQTYANLEFVFVDDATPDNSIGILQDVIGSYPGIEAKARIIRHTHNKGIAVARNTCVEVSKGEFLCFVDSDDWLELNAIELLINKQRETHADIVTAQAWCHKDGMVKPCIDGGWNMDKKSMLVGLLTYKLSTSLWRRLIRRDLYKEHHITCDERASGAEDFQTLPRLVYYASNIAGIDDYIYHYDRSNESSIMNCINNVGTQLGGLVAVQQIVKFFADKEDFLRDLTQGMDIRNIHYRMHQNATHGNKRGYDTFCQLMSETNRDYWYQVKWNSRLVRSLESNYYSYRLLQYLISCRNFVRKEFQNLL